MKALKKELLEECASANECTGLYQKVSLDADEIARFHSLFVKDTDIDE